MRPPLSPHLDGLSAYRVPRHPAPIRWRLDSGEGMLAPGELLTQLELADADALVRRYPDRAALEQQIAQRLEIDPARVLVTAGGDDALDRACRALLSPGRNAIFPTPSFEMIERYVRWTGAELRTVPWPRGPWPLERVLDDIDDNTTAVIAVSPNNPTGAVVTADDLIRLTEAAPHVAVLLDHAYVEFADEDLTGLALELPNTLVFRTLSKAWGLAGLRVGWVAGPEWLISALRVAGNPYSVSAPSLFLAGWRMEHAGHDAERFVARVRQEREAVEGELASYGFDVHTSQGNFAFARSPRVPWLRDALAGLGLSVRTWPDKPDLEDAVRVTLPGHNEAFSALVDAIDAALAPEALLFDMDGVLADTGASYRRAIAETAASYGVTVTQDDIRAAKAEGNANNDWVLTTRLIRRGGVHAAMDEVTARFERLYQGDDAQPGLKHTERLLLPREALERLRARVRLGVVTGRPRSDARDFLERNGIADLFEVVICMEDGPPKPDPTPVRLALTQLGVADAWMIGDTVDDVRAARDAGVVPLGVVPPGDTWQRLSPELLAAGAARVLEHTTEIEALLDAIVPRHP